MVADQLGTPRIIADRTGSLSGIKRHDYLPFGEELLAGSGNRTTAQGYGVADGVRQKFTDKERDSETGLDYFEARYYASMQGRFISPDSVAGSTLNPQTLNLYAYVQNNPLNFIDPTGHAPIDPADRHKFLKNELPSKRDAWDAAHADLLHQWRVQDYGAMYLGMQAQNSVPQDSAETQQETETVEGASSNSTMVIIWEGLWGESANPDRWFGHVSYITMQNDKSYSWQGIMNWTIKQPSSVYTDQRSQDSAGMGYLLDFGPKLNAKFQKAMRTAYDAFAGIKVPYGPINYNCGRAFNVAINAIRKDIGVSKSKFIFPSRIKAYIEKNLQKYIVSQTPFPKH